MLSWSIHPFSRYPVYLGHLALDHQQFFVYLCPWRTIYWIPPPRHGSEDVEGFGASGTRQAIPVPRRTIKDPRCASGKAANLSLSCSTRGQTDWGRCRIDYSRVKGKRWGREQGRLERKGGGCAPRLGQPRARRLLDELGPFGHRDSRSGRKHDDPIARGRRA